MEDVQWVLTNKCNTLVADLSLSHLLLPICWPNVVAKCKCFVEISLATATLVSNLDGDQPCRWAGGRGGGDKP